MNTTSSTAACELTLAGAPLAVRRSPRARRVRLVLDAATGGLRLVLPACAALAPALRWAAGHEAWARAALAEAPAAVPLGPGAVVPFDGVERRLAWDAAAGRGVVVDGDALRVGGPAELAGGRVLRWLRAEAARRLEAETRALAAAHGIAVGRVGVGDPRGRWGSCSGSGDIRYSWRLVMAPPAVRASVVAHELAHRLHMDHSPAFHAAAERLFGRDPVAERAWLRAHGAALHRVGRG